MFETASIARVVPAPSYNLHALPRIADESRISHRVSLDQFVPVLVTKSNDHARAPSKANRKNCPLAKATIPGKSLFPAILLTASWSRRLIE